VFIISLCFTLSVVGTATQWVFKLDDGERWRIQSTNVVIWQVVVVLLIVIRMISVKKGGREDESSLVEVGEGERMVGDNNL